MEEIIIEEHNKGKIKSEIIELFDKISKNDVDYTAIIITSNKIKTKSTTCNILNNAPMLKQMIHFEVLLKGVHELNKKMLSETVKGMLSLLEEK